MNGIKDTFSVVDDVTLEHSDGRVLTGADDGGCRMIGKVKIIGKDYQGNTLFTKTEDNALLINGASYIAEKINNRRCRFAPPPLDVVYGSHEQAQVDINKKTLSEEYICGMVFGTGGCTNTYNTVRPVMRNALTVPEMTPIRVVPAAEDLHGEERNRYFLRKPTYIGGVEYAMYYGKTFDADPNINVVFESGDDIPADVNKYDDPGFMMAYTQYILTVNANDIREYFKLTDGNTALSRINSIGLVAGYPRVNKLGYTEFYNVRCLTTVNTESLELKDNLSQIVVYYDHHVR